MNVPIEKLTQLQALLQAPAGFYPALPISSAEASKFDPKAGALEGPLFLPVAHLTWGIDLCLPTKEAVEEFVNEHRLSLLPLSQQFPGTVIEIRPLTLMSALLRLSGSLTTTREHAFQIEKQAVAVLAVADGSMDPPAFTFAGSRFPGLIMPQAGQHHIKLFTELLEKVFGHKERNASPISAS